MPASTAETLIAAAKRVLIADDHPLYRDALRAVIPQACPQAEIAEACTQEEVLAQVVSDSAFDLIVLDLNLPGAMGYSCLKQTRQVAKLTPIIVVSALDDAAIMGKAVLAGATAYVPKSASRQVLVDAIRIIMEGGTYMPAQAMAALRSAQSAGQATEASAVTQDELTSRQRRVLKLLAEGFSNKHIARDLDISEITVKAHVSAILKKLGVANRVQAAIEARRLLAR
jgi:DNA-binding NarL/FixJ family response regulator